MTRLARPETVLAVLVLFAAPALAAHGPFVVADAPVGAVRAPLDADCSFGSRAVDHLYSGWWAGDESYAVLVSPPTSPCACSAGISVQSVFMSLELDASADLWVQASFREAVSTGPGCWRPGDLIQTSLWVNVVGPAVRSVVDVEIPAFFWCAEMYDPYFVTVDFIGGSADQLRLVGGGEPADCVVWNDWGAGWVDLVGEMGFLDPLAIWAEAGCCSDPVGSDAESWGSVKARFR